MIIPKLPRWTGLVSFAVCVSLLASFPVGGQAQKAEDGEIKAVIRIGKQLMEDLVARREIIADVPFYARVMGFDCHGVAHGTAKLSVDVQTAGGNATFIVDAHGTAHTCVIGVHAPIVVLGQAGAPFASRSFVRFDGRKLTLLETIPRVEVHAGLDSIQTRRGGVVGRALGRMALPIGEHLLPRAEAQATPIAETILKDFVNELAELIIEKLNETTPMEKTMFRLFPQTKDWEFQMSTDSQFLQAAYGPRNSRVPVLPEHPSRMKDARVELWLHTTTKEAQALAKLTKVPLAKELVRKYVETTVPELAALAEDRSVDAVGSWLVISVGAPKEDLGILPKLLENRAKVRKTDPHAPVNALDLIQLK
jgi:hypothetical protein